MRSHLFPILFFLLLTIIVFFKFFTQDLYPFPGNYLLAWFEPFKTLNFSDGAIQIAHKPLASDVFRQIFPFKTLAMDMFKNLNLPFWNPYNGAGMPLMATINVGFFDPLNILYFLFNNPNAWFINIVIQFFLISLFSYIYCKKIGLYVTSSIFSSIVFSLSGIVIARLIFGMYGLAFALLPLSLYLIESYIANKKTKLIFLLPIVILIIIVSTQPQIAMYIFAFVFLYSIYRLKENSLKEKLFIFILMALGGGLASFQLFPTYELFQYANVSQNSSSFIFENFLLPLSHLITIIIPNYFGNPATYNYWGDANYIQTISYVGSIPVMLAILGTLAKPLKTALDLRKFFIVAAIIPITLSLDWVFTRVLFSLPIPLISTGNPARIFLLSTFAISMLAGFGLNSLIFNFKSKHLKYSLISFTTIVLMIIIITFALYAFGISCPDFKTNSCREVALRNTILEVFIYFLFLFSIISSFFIVRLRKYIGILVIVLVIVVGFYNTNKFLPASPIKHFLPETELTNTLRENTPDSRVFGIGEANIPTDLATYYKFYDPQYYHPLYIKRYGRLVDFSETENINNPLERSDVEIVKTASPDADLETRRNRLFNLLSVNYLIYKKAEVPKQNNHNIIWENENWYLTKINSLPRAYLVNNIIVEENDKEILDNLFDPDFDPSRSAILEKEITLNQNGEASGEINILNDTGNVLTIEAKTDSNALLILTDNYYPGWNAYVNGDKQEILRANYTFRAIELPQGDNLVKFSYEPLSLKLGVISSIISLVILITLFIYRKKLVTN